MAADCDIAILGAGPGGYVAALKAAELGAKVSLIEADQVGGTCLNRGCIPSKALLASAELLHHIRRADDYGLVVQGVEPDVARVFARKEKIVNTLTRGVGSLLQAAGVQVIKGEGTLAAPDLLRVDGPDGTQEVKAGKVIIATGSEAVRPPIPGLETAGVIGSDEALCLGAAPGKLMVIGAGVVGLELAVFFRLMGSEVTVVEVLPRVLAGEDADVSEYLQRSLRRLGLSVLCNHRVTALSAAGGQVLARVEADRQVQDLRFDQVICASGRKPNLRGIDAIKLGLNVENGRLKAGTSGQTGVPGVYAVGDVRGETMLAHHASAQGVTAVEHIFGSLASINLVVVPRTISCIPEIGAVGLTEEQAAATGYDVAVGKFPFAANGRALTLGETEGFIKVVSSKRHGEILGVSIVGPRATDLISLAAMAIGMEATVQEAVSIIQAHPTLAEAFVEAALDVSGQALHIPQKRNRTSIR